MRAKAPYARVVVVSYPMFFPSDGGGFYQCAGIRKSDQIWMNDGVDRADDAIGVVAQDAGFEYVDMSDVNAGHELCTDEPAMNSIIPDGFGPASESFHLNERGHRLMADRVASALGGTVEPDLVILPEQTVRRTFTVRGQQFTVNVAYGGRRGFGQTEGTIDVTPWAFGGWQAPVDAVPVRNVVRAGRAVPLVFSVDGPDGALVPGTATDFLPAKAVRGAKPRGGSSKSRKRRTRSGRADAVKFVVLALLIGGFLLFPDQVLSTYMSVVEAVVSPIGDDLVQDMQDSMAPTPAPQPLPQARGLAACQGPTIARGKPPRTVR